MGKEQSEEKMSFREAFKMSYQAKIAEKTKAKETKVINESIPHDFYTYLYQKCTKRCIINFHNKVMDVGEIKCLHECANNHIEINKSFNESNTFVSFLS